MAEKKKHRSAGLKKPDNFEELEKEFETVLNELLTDESLERFRKEYEKLHDALLNSHESERRLMNKVRELNEEIACNAEKVATAVRLSKEDEATITNLTQETEKAWKLVEYLQDKEVWSRETITTLRTEIEQLKILVERSADLAIQFQNEEFGGPSAVNPVSALKAAPAADKPAGESEQKQEELKKMIFDLEQEESRLKGDIYQTQIDLRSRTLELQKERTRRAKAEADVTNLELALAQRDETIQEKERNIKSLLDNSAEQEVTTKELRVTTERCIKEVETLTASLQKVQAEYEKQFVALENLQMEHQSLQNEAHSKSDRLNVMADNNKKLTKTKILLERKVKTMTEQRHVLRSEKEHLAGVVVVREKTIEANKRQQEADSKRITDLMRERDVFNKNLVKQVHATEKQANLVSLGEQTNRNMGQEIMGFHRESEKQRRIIHQMERERDRFINENGELTLKVMKGVEDIQMRDLYILDYKKRVEEMDSRLKIQQNMYEAVHQERNMYSRMLVETQDEMGETKNQLRIMEHQSNQLKEEVANREAAVVKEHMECIRLEKERDLLIAEIQMLKNQLREVEQVVKDLRAEEQNLQKVIAASDEIIKRQKRELDSIISERDILGSQLVRRNDELSLLYQKTKLLQILIENGNRLYDQRIEDMRLLRLEVKRQRNQNRCLQKSCENVASYKQELYSVHREVLHERARCAALEIELSHPRQIHRWRGLEITDPSKFELLQKVQALQKRLINRTEEVVEVERVVQEKDRLYLELRAVLERQPGPEVTNQISTYQRVLKEKNKHLKGVLAELNMYKTDIEINNYDMELLESRYVDMKKKYFREKKRRHDLHEYKTLQKRGIPSIIQGKDQFTGGGFKVTQKFNVQ